MIIVIDGPSGSGKSTMAKKLARELGFTFFDTGAMYRSVCLYLLQKKIPLENHGKIQEAILDFHFEFKEQDGNTQFLVNGQDVSKEIRSNVINKNVSIVAAYSFVRKMLVKLQKKFAENTDAVFEGRDMGTVVFPNADLKFFLVADPKIRAQRRYKELRGLYPQSDFNLAEIESDIIQRDQYDSTREISPLKKAANAIEINSSHQSVQRILKIMQSYIKELKA